MLQDTQNVLRLPDIPVGNDGNGNGFLDGPDAVPIRLSAVDLGAGSSMDGNRGSPGLFQDPGKFDAVAAPHIPAPAELGGHGDVHGFHHGLDDFPCQFRGTHQSRAVAVVDNFPHGAAHVDIQDIRPGVLHGDLGGLRHAHRVAAEDLNGGGVLPRKLPQKGKGLLILIAKGLGGDQLRAGIARPQLRADPAEGRVGDAGHGGQRQFRGNRDGSDVHGTRLLSSGDERFSSPASYHNFGEMSTSAFSRAAARPRPVLSLPFCNLFPASPRSFSRQFLSKQV